MKALKKIWVAAVFASFVSGTAVLAGDPCASVADVKSKGDVSAGSQPASAPASTSGSTAAPATDSKK